MCYIVNNFYSISERLIKTTLRLSKNYTIKVIQLYALTTSHSEEETEDFYEELQDTIDEDKTNATIVMGDLNAKIGINPDIKETSTRKLGLGNRNDRGTRLVDFATYNNLKIANTFFKKRAKKRWTWRSPNDRTRNEIDYILTENLKNMTDTSTINKVNVGSDRRLLRCKQERFKKLQKSQKANMETLKQHNEPFKIELTNRFHQLPTEDISEWNRQIINITKECAIKAAGKQKKQKDPGLPSEIKNLMDQRRNVKRASVKNQKSMRSYAKQSGRRSEKTPELKIWN